MHRDVEHSQPVTGPEASESKAEILRAEIQSLEARDSRHPQTGSAPSHAYVPRREYRLAVACLAALLLVLGLFVFSPFGSPSWQGLVQPAESRIINAPHAGRWIIAAGVTQGAEIPAGQLLGRVEDTRLRESLAAKEIDLRAAEAAATTLREGLARQKDVHASALQDHQRSEITRAELTEVESTLREVTLRSSLADAALAGLEEETARLRNLCEREQIVSPRAGILLTLTTRTDGTYISAGDLLAEVGSRELAIHFEVPEKQMTARLKVGDRVSFSCAGFTRRFVGSIEQIEPRLREEERGPIREKSRYGLVIVKPLEPLPADIRPGLLATGQR